MLAASWTRWRSITRSGIAAHRRLYSVAITTSASQPHRTTTSLSSVREVQTHLGGPETRQKPAKDFPIDVLNNQASLQALLRSIEQGAAVEESSRHMADFLDSLPGDANSRASAFRHLKAILMLNSKSHLPLLTQLGIGYASLGMGRMVNEEILPLMESFALEEDLAHFKTELNQHTPFEATSEAVQPASIFEDGSIPAEAEPMEEPMDFVTALGGMSDMTPDAVAVNYPEPLLPVDDLSEVFEDQGSEYLEFEPTTLSSNHSSRQSSGMLVKLVEQDLYDKAYDLLKEMQDIGSPIQPSFIYEKAAVAALQKPKTRLADKISLFAAWFSLIPEEYQAPAGTTFRATIRYVLQSPFLHLPLLIRLSLILAQKGYVDNLTKSVIPPILRATSPSEGMKFIDDLHQANLGYLTKQQEHVRDAEFRAKKVATNIRGIAIRTFAFTGRLSEAVALLPDPNNPTFKLSIYTYNVVLKRMWMLPSEVRAETTKLVEALRASNTTSVQGPTPPTLENIRIRELAEVVGWKETETEGLMPFEGNLSATLRYIKNHIVTEERSDIVHPFVLVNFMSMYLATGRTRALEILLNRAIRKSFFATGNFVLAEMLFYRSIQQPQLVVKTFVDHFFISGVPREDMIGCYRRLQALYENYDPSSGDSPPMRRFYPFDEFSTLPRGKMWPRTEHVNLAWDALVHLTAQDRHIEDLYTQLVSFTRLGIDEPESPDVAESDLMPIPQQWKTPVGGAAFTPFIYRMMYYRGPGYGVRILRDMLRLGVRPTVYHYTELASFYARRGDFQRAMVVLDGMESRIKVKDAGIDSEAIEDDSDEQLGVSGPIRVHKLPHPTIVTYTAVLRGFLIAKHLEGAEEVYSRIVRLGEHVLGESPELELATKDLEDFRLAGPNWVYPHGRKSAGSL